MNATQVLDRLASDYDQLCGPSWKTDPAVVMGFVQAAKNAVRADCPTIGPESSQREALQVVQNAEQEQNALAVQQPSDF